MESILTSIKKMCGISEDYPHFDADMIMNINSALSILTQLGVGPETGFFISDSEATWDDFVSDQTIAGIAKMYVYFRVLLGFDNNQSAAVLDIIHQQIKEFEWRLNALMDEKNGGDADD